MILNFVTLQTLNTKTLNFFKQNIMYPEEMVKPMRAELSDAGFQDLHTAEAVEQRNKNQKEQH